MLLESKWKFVLFLLILFQFKDTHSLTHNHFYYQKISLSIFTHFVVFFSAWVCVCMSIVYTSGRPTIAHYQMATKHFCLSEWQWQQNFYPLHKENSKRFTLLMILVAQNIEAKEEERDEKANILCDESYQYAVRVFTNIILQRNSMQYLINTVILLVVYKILELNIIAIWMRCKVMCVHFR